MNCCPRHKSGSQPEKASLVRSEIASKAVNAVDERLLQYRRVTSMRIKGIALLEAVGFSARRRIRLIAVMELS